MAYTYITDLTELVKFIELHNNYTALDAYIAPIQDKEKEAIISQIKERQRVIILLSGAEQDVGYLDIFIKTQRLSIASLLLPPTLRISDIKNAFEDLKKQYPHHLTTYITPLSDPDKIQLLQKLGFSCSKEHLQMEKKLSITPPEAVAPSLNWLIVNRQHELSQVKKLMDVAMTHSSYRYSKAELVMVLQDPAKTIVLGYKKQMPVAFVIIEIDQTRNHRQKRKVLYIEELGVHPLYRGQGYGQAILDYCELFARQFYLNEMRLHVFRSNQIAYHLYKKNGYQEVKAIGHFSLLNETI